MEIQQFVETALGLNAEEVNAQQIVARAVVVYILALIMIRVGNKRFLGKNTAFDVILAIILGSVVSRAINGDAPFFPTLVAGFILVMLHWMMSSMAFHIVGFRTVVKGHERWLIKDGEIQWDEMRNSSITKNDLMKAVRAQLHQNTLDDVTGAVLERDGSISLLTK